MEVGLPEELGYWGGLMGKLDQRQWNYSPACFLAEWFLSAA